MNKSTWIAVLVFAALAAGGVLSLQEKPERGITRVSFAGTDPAKIDRIVIGGPKPIELRKDKDVWKVGDKPADATAVKNLLDGVKSIDTSDVVTRNHERFAALEVDDEKGTRVQTFSGNSAGADFVIGAAASGGSNVRVGDAVYLAKRVMRGQFSRETSLWLDRKLFSENASDPTKVEVKLAGQSPYTLVKEGDTWKPGDSSSLPPDFRFDGNAARNLVSSLVSAQANDVLDEDPGNEKTGLGDNADLLVFHLAAGDPRTLRIGANRDDASVYARASARPELVTLPGHLAKSLRKPITDLRDLSLMAFDTTAAKRLEIVKDNERTVLAKEGDVWKIAESTQQAPAGFELDPGAVTRRIASVGSLRAVASIEPDATATTGLDKPARKVSVTLADERVVTLAFGDETKWDNADAVYTRGNADDKTYVVRPFARDNALGGLDTFAKREQTSPLANLDPNTLKNLPPEVRESLMKQIEQQKQKDELIKKAMEAHGKN